MAISHILSTTSFHGFRCAFLMVLQLVLTTCNFLATKDIEQLSSSLSNHDQIDLLLELEASAGRDHRIATERRVARLTEAMRSTFNALPKDESGRLGASGVRYMLHRFFVQRHGWFVNGLDSEGDAWNTSSPTEFIGTHVNQEAQSAFDKQLSTHGFDLHHAAVLGATLENFVHIEAIERLQAAYRITGLEPSDNDASDTKITRAMHTYLLMYILQKKKHYSDVTPQWVGAALEKINRIYPTWNKTVEFMENVRRSVMEEENILDSSEDVSGMSHSWNIALKILERFGEGYGRFQNRDCVVLKRLLVSMEEPGTGRVPLHRFYGGLSSNSSWHFSESVPYLRMLGAVDESDRAHTSVIIPNYLNGPNNCVAGSKFYDVCCIDECDALISHLEQHLQASAASPQQLAHLVAHLPSDTVSAPRLLPSALLGRLEQIAEHHGGLVPLHGRLFAQWMHHAYPRECSYPHVSGTTKSMTPLEYKQETGEKASIVAAQALKIIKDRTESSFTKEDLNRDLPWSSEEELFVCRPGLRNDSEGNTAQKSYLFSSGIKSALALPAVFCLLVTLLQLFPKGRAGTKAFPMDGKNFV